MSLKSNRGNIYHAIVAHCASTAALDTLTTCESGHGRHEQRTVGVWIVPAPERTAGFAAGCAGLRRIIRVERTCTGTRSSHQLQYYISSLENMNARGFGALIRRHWHIENRLHYPRDVAMGEDRSCVRNRRLATAFAMLRTIAINLMRSAGFDSIKAALLHHSNRIDRILKLILMT